MAQKRKRKSMTAKLAEIINQLYNIAPKVEVARTGRVFFDEKRKLATLKTEEDVVLVSQKYIGMFDVYRYKTNMTTENLYRFRIVLGTKKKQRLLFKFEAFQFTETGSLFIENFKNYDWDTVSDVFKEFIQIALSKINFVMKMNRVTLELNKCRVRKLEMMIFEKEMIEIGYSKEDDSVPTNRGQTEKGDWTVLAYSKTDPSEGTRDEEEEAEDDEEDD